MSLDFYLMGDVKTASCRCTTCGHEHDHTFRTALFEINITHNLNKMADHAGVYGALWRPDELSIKSARELIEPLREGLQKLRANPGYFQKFNAENGWGLYEHFVPFVEQVLAACEEYPDATVEVSR